MIRAFKTTDGQSVAQFLRAVHAEDPVVNPFADEAFDALVTGWGQGRDFLVAEAHGALAGVAMSHTYRVVDRDDPVRSFQIVVGPTWRRRGIATALLDRIEAQDSNRVVRRTTLPGGAPEGAALLAGRRYEEVQATLLMRRVGLPPELMPLPPGYVLRDPRLPAQAGALAEVYNDACRGAFGFSPLTAAEIGVDHGRLLALDAPDGSVVGWVKTLPGVLHMLQVSRNHQRRGLGRALTIAALHALAQQGYGEVELTVDAANNRAVALYERLDFFRCRRDITLECEA